MFCGGFGPVQATRGDERVQHQVVLHGPEHGSPEPNQQTSKGREGGPDETCAGWVEDPWSPGWRHDCRVWALSLSKVSSGPDAHGCLREIRGADLW